MKSRRTLTSVVIPICWLIFVSINPLRAEPAPPQSQRTPAQVLAGAIHRWADLIEPPAGAAPQTLVAKMKVTRADGLPNEAMGATAQIAFEAPAHVKIS